MQAETKSKQFSKMNYQEQFDFLQANYPHLIVDFEGRDVIKPYNCLTRTEHWLYLRLLYPELPDWQLKEHYFNVVTDGIIQFAGSGDSATEMQSVYCVMPFDLELEISKQKRSVKVILTSRESDTVSSSDLHNLLNVNK